MHSVTLPLFLCLLFCYQRLALVTVIYGCVVSYSYSLWFSLGCCQYLLCVCLLVSFNKLLVNSTRRGSGDLASKYTVSPSIHPSVRRRRFVYSITLIPFGIILSYLGGQFGASHVRMISHPCILLELSSISCYSLSDIIIQFGRHIFSQV